MPTRDIVELNKKKYPPGGTAAIAEGCTCSPVDNCQGRGYLGRNWTWSVRINCPLHFCTPIKLKNRKTNVEETE